MSHTHILSNRKALLVAALVTMTASCKVTKPYQRPEQVADNALFRDVNTTDSTTIANMPWQQLFTDTDLQALIQEGISNNLDLKIAVARIKSASANLQQSKLAFLPTLDATASVTKKKLSVAQGAGFLATTSYELSLS
ncbi:MAG TPA: TolC family protein, partial [Chitinophaga sp.]|nr:TolC family protein [Chitinophaga sp.]